MIQEMKYEMIKAMFLASNIPDSENDSRIPFYMQPNYSDRFIRSYVKINVDFKI